MTDGAHRPRKRFGQHFLHDAGVVRRIVEAIAPRAGESIVEIGPGEGVLTEPLLARGAKLQVVEVDRDLAARLRERYRDALVVHEGDALEFDFGALPPGTRVAGNLPYNISTPLLFHLLRAPAALRDLHVMLQKEVIDRICAQPGTGEYGRLTVMLAPWIEAEPLFDVGPGAFRPPPRVWSAVARLRVRREPAFAVDERFGRLVAAAFSQRRKTLRNALRALVDAAAIERCGIDPGARPETLAPAQFGALARLVASS